MLYLLLGPDDFSKKLYLNSLAKEMGADLEFFLYEKSADLGKLSEQELFGKPKLFVLENLIVKIISENSLEHLVKLTNQIIFLEDKLDKRFNENKEILENKKITVKEFPLPTGLGLISWIEKRVNALGGSIETEAAKNLSFHFEGLSSGGYGYTPAFSLWQVDLEIQKLLAFAENKTISKEAVRNLATGEAEINIFKISDAVAAKNIVLAQNLISEFLASQSSADAKNSILFLSTILAEQFRNILAVQNLQKAGQSQEAIAKTAGWKKVGRVSVMERLGAGFTVEKIKSFLEKLSLLDQEMKLSSSPPRVVFDLVLIQLMT